VNETLHLQTPNFKLQTISTRAIFNANRLKDRPVANSRRVATIAGMGRILLTAIVAGMLTTGALRAEEIASAAPKTFELNDGRFTEVTAPQPAAPIAPDATLQRVEQLIDRQQFSAARRDVLDWLLANKSSPNYDMGLYLVAQALNGEDDPIRAFYYVDELLETFPASAYYVPGLELQYSIGDSLLGGRKIKSLGLLLFRAYDDGVEMMFRLQSRAPGSPIAERSLRRTADYYFADAQFDLAADAYAAHAKAYPRHPNLPEILVREAFSNYAQFTGVRFDPTPLVNARAQMQEIIQSYPEVAQRENLSSFVDSIDKTLARKLFVTADFYRRTSKPDAERFINKALVEQYPQSDEAQRARKENQ